MGPLTGLKVIEMKGIGPGPYAGMLLADMGAEVIVIERSSKPDSIGPPSAKDVHSRGKKSIAIDIKNPVGLAAFLKLVAKTDVLIEGFRPGVAERVGFGPDDCLAANPKLVYGRVTGWGQSGPLANAAGHDINYIALTGALAAIGTRGKPVPPLNLVGDYAGGSLFLVAGILAALLESRQSGKGQVIDAAITDGSASLMSMFHSLASCGLWSTDRQSNLLDGGSYYYDVYETSDGKWISIGPLEPQFYALLVELAGLDEKTFGEQADIDDWPAKKERLAEVFRSRSRDEWCELLEGTDVCCAPVLDFEEAPEHKHNEARGTYIDIDGIVQPAPAPRFSRSECEVPGAPHAEGADTEEVLQQWGFGADDIAELRRMGALS